MRVFASRSRVDIGIYNARPKRVTASLNKLVNKCSNPLNYHTKPCVALWEYIDKFNRQVSDLTYQIDHLNDTLNPEDYFQQQSRNCDDYDQCNTDECRVFD